MPGGCHAHPLRPAAFRCEGCERALCEDCVEEGHRLLLCPVCGERAVALAAAGPATVKERAGARRLRAAAAYGWSDLLGYCFRGDGAWIFWIAVALFLVLRFFLAAFALASWAQKLLPLALSALFAVLLLWVVPAQLARVVRTTLAGRDQLPDWAPAHEFDDRQREILALLLAILLAVAPTLLARGALGCGSAGPPSLGCRLAVVLSLPPGIALGCLGFGAYAFGDRLFDVLRIDLHLRLLARLGGPGWATAGGIGLGVVGALVLGRLLAFVPVLGSVAQTVLLVWTLFTGAHAVGVLFRRAPTAIQEVYG